jgi:hypothetical protein
MENMMKRVDAYLDGDLPASALTGEERAHAELLNTLAAAIRADLPGAPEGLPSSLITRIRELQPAPAMTTAGVDPWADPLISGTGRLARAASGLLHALWQPLQVTFTLRPAWAAGVATVAAMMLMLPAAEEARLGGGSGAEAAPRVFVHFSVQAEGASTVALAGSFTGWEPRYELAERRPGVWSITIPVEPGVHDYAFIVDGEQWLADPGAAAVDDGFGGVNSRLALLPAS